MLTELSAERRDEQVASLFKAKPRVLFVFAHHAQYDMERASQRAAVNWICTSDFDTCKRNDVATLRFTQKGKPAFERRKDGDATEAVKYSPEHFEPLTVCAPERLLDLRPEDFDGVVFYGDAATSRRWLYEAMRVGSKGITIFYGTVKL